MQGFVSSWEQLRRQATDRRVAGYDRGDQIGLGAESVLEDDTEHSWKEHGSGSSVGAGSEQHGRSLDMPYYRVALQVPSPVMSSSDSALRLVEEPKLVQFYGGVGAKAGGAKAGGASKATESSQEPSMVDAYGGCAVCTSVDDSARTFERRPLERPRFRMPAVWRTTEYRHERLRTRLIPSLTAALDHCSCSCDDNGVPGQHSRTTTASLLLCRAAAHEAADHPLAALEDYVDAWILDRFERDFEEDGIDRRDVEPEAERQEGAASETISDTLNSSTATEIGPATKSLRSPLMARLSAAVATKEDALGDEAQLLGCFAHGLDYVDGIGSSLLAERAESVEGTHQDAVGEKYAATRGEHRLGQLLLDAARKARVDREMARQQRLSPPALAASDLHSEGSDETSDDEGIGDALRSSKPPATPNWTPPRSSRATDGAQSARVARGDRLAASRPRPGSLPSSPQVRRVASYDTLSYDLRREWHESTHRRTSSSRMLAAFSQPSAAAVQEWRRAGESRSPTPLNAMDAQLPSYGIGGSDPSTGGSAGPPEDEPTGPESLLSLEEWLNTMLSAQQQQQQQHMQPPATPDPSDPSTLTESASAGATPAVATSDASNALNAVTVSTAEDEMMLAESALRLAGTLADPNIPFTTLEWRLGGGSTSSSAQNAKDRADSLESVPENAGSPPTPSPTAATPGTDRDIDSSTGSAADADATAADTAGARAPSSAAATRPAADLSTPIPSWQRGLRPSLRSVLPTAGGGAIAASEVCLRLIMRE
jgi:hypothetical protein|eukprot:COSAG01_NODE_622_length_14779_cov_69.589305_11_plen_770_part_00